MGMGMGMGMGVRMSTVHTYSSVLSRTLQEEVVEGEFTIYCMVSICLSLSACAISCLLA